MKASSKALYENLIRILGSEPAFLHRLKPVLDRLDDREQTSFLALETLLLQEKQKRETAFQQVERRLAKENQTLKDQVRALQRKES